MPFPGTATIPRWARSSSSSACRGAEGHATAPAFAPVEDRACARRRRLHRWCARSARCGRSTCSVNRTVNQFDVYVGIERRLLRRRAGRQRRDARGDDAGRQPAGADAVSRHRPRSTAAAQPGGVRAQGHGLRRGRPCRSCASSRRSSARCRSWTFVLGLAEGLPSGVYSGSGLESYMRSVLSDPDRSDDFRVLDPELYLAATDLDTVDADRLRRPRTGTTSRSLLRSGRPRRCRWFTSRSGCAIAS